jgi:hypothetical protein
MARRSRVELNRAALDEVHAAFADGIFDLARAIIRVAENDAPDAPPYGEGLVERGGAAVWVKGRKTHETTSNPIDQKVRKPLGLVLKRSPSVIVGVAGWGFPALFQEFGTVHHRAQPFFSPAASEVLGSETRVILSAAMERRLAGKRSPRTAGIRRRIVAARAAKAARSTP